MHIAFCITTLDAGGAERQLTELATRLPRERFEPAIAVLGREPSPPHDELVRKLRAHSIPVTFLGARTIWQTPIVYRRLSLWLRDWRPDLLQCFLAHANVLGAVAAHRLGIRPIVTGIRVAELRANWHNALQRRTARFVDRQVCVSRSVAEFAKRGMRLPPEQLTVIPNGVDVTRFEAVEPLLLAELGLDAERRMILFIGRLEHDKRPQWLLERMPEIARRLPRHNLVVVGQGPLADNLHRTAKRLGVDHRVYFVGWRPDVPRLLANADLLVLTSASEGMSNAILEAMASARPVVATDVHGAQELLGDDHGGQLVATDDPAAFVDAVARVAGDAKLAHQLGQHNRDRVRREFSFERTVASYVALYDALLTAKNR